MNRSIFKAYDVRGLYPKDINEDSMAVIGKACAHYFKEGTFVVAHDARHGSEKMARVVERAVAEEAERAGKKLDMLWVGLSTTPMFYFLVDHFKASGGCMITASHNPKEYNGVKMVKEGAETVSGTDMLAYIDNLHLI